MENIIEMLTPVLNKCIELVTGLSGLIAKKAVALAGAGAKKATKAIGGKVLQKMNPALRVLMCASATVALLSGVLYFLGKKR